MDLEEVLLKYIEKYGEDYDIDTVLLTDEKKIELSAILKESIEANKPITSKQLNDFLGYDPNDPDILI